MNILPFLPNTFPIPRATWLAMISLPLFGMATLVPRGADAAGSPFGYHPASVPSPGEPRSFSYAEDIGIRWHRDSLYVFWFMAHKDLHTDNIDFAIFDQIVRNVPKGLSILANIAPEGDIDEGRCLKGSWVPVDMQAYARFVRAAVERYDGDGKDDMPGLVSPIKYWQVGNEPDMAHGERPRRIDFWKLQQATYEAIKQADAGSTVLLPGYGGGGPSGGYLRWFDELYVPMLKQLQGKYADAFDFHWYVGISGNHLLMDADTGKSVLTHIRRRLADTGYPSSMPIWATEMGVHSGTPRHGPPLGFKSERQQAEEQLKMFISALAGGTERVFGAWGLMEGEMSGGDHFFDLTGIMYDGRGDGDRGYGKPKLAFYAYKKMVTELAEVDWKRAEIVHAGSGSEGFWVIKATRRAMPFLIAWREPKAGAHEAGDDRLTLDLQVGEGSHATMIEGMPSADAGHEVHDYRAAFGTSRLKIQEGKISIPVGSAPAYIEIAK